MIPHLSKNHLHNAIFIERTAPFIQEEASISLQSALYCQASIKRSDFMHRTGKHSSSWLIQYKITKSNDNGYQRFLGSAPKLPDDLPLI